MLDFENKYLQFIENLDEGIWIIDDKANTTFVNSRMAEMLGFSSEEMIGKHLFYFMDADGIESAKKYLKRREAGIAEAHPFEFTSKSGKKILTNVKTYPLIDDTGKYNGALAAISNISEQSKLKDTISDLETKFKTIFDSASVGLGVLDENLNLVQVNKKLAENLNYSRSELCGKHIFSIIPQERENELTDYFSMLLDGSLNTIYGEHKFLRKNNSIGWGLVDFFTFKEVHKEKPTIMFSVRDISEQKEIEYELSKKEALFKSVLDHSSSAITIWDKKLRNLYANPNAFAIAGKSVKPFSPIKHFKDTFPNSPDFSNKWEKRLLECFRTGNANYFEEEDVIFGHIIYSESSITPIKDLNGDIFAAVIYFRDITQRKQMEKELRDKDKFAALGNIAAQLSHEIKSPLASISMNLDFLSRTLVLNEKQKKSFDLIHSEIERLRIFLKEMLRFSTDIILEKSQFDISEIIKNVASLLNPLFKEKNIKFTSKVKPQILFGDAKKIKSVLIDLVKNSVDAIASEGKIDIITSIKENENMFQIFIKDSGIGISDSTKLFEPFYTTKAKGSGLGLLISKTIIEKHGGMINLESSKPGETIFQIQLPLDETSSL